MGQSKKDKMMGWVTKFANARPILALKDGMIAILPLTVVGSIFLIIGALPFEGINNWIASIFGQNWTEPFMQVHGGTFAIMALVSCFTIAYSYANHSKQNISPLPAGVLALAAFFILMKPTYTTESGEIISGVVDKTWLGGEGMIGAIIIGIVVGWIYSSLVEKNIVIKMPEQVPEMISNQFVAMIPAFVVFLVAMVVHIASSKLTDGGTFIELIYRIVQVPLQGLTGSLGGALGIALAISLLWWVGIHGQSVVNGIVTGLLLSNLAHNQALQSAGELALENGAHIVTQQFLDNYIVLSGSGITFGAVVFMIFFAKSEQYKSIGKVAAVPSLFNINEPVVFGMPVVMNPLMFVPFVLTPVIAALILYVAIATGFMQPFAGVTVPWSTPMVISGFMVGGWRGALVQVIILICSVLIYYPFMKRADNIAYENEQSTKK